ncbi:hypothetical protein [Lacihabitans soyangensis]|uniref:Uncharacterized protein n=1 Tax=Lacihabitans soyangensis TaxID=869394 RepID=A0AAE3H5Y7_9BACT|nr:hypothetical protein [Lacihabitans soyangensis]MCP9764651.1 hypothetical protein [Lacihabitans soyangensis]
MAKLIEKDLEEAILALPTKEKNKILIRLIDKNKVLVEQLHFKLLEHPEIDLKLRQDSVADQIENLKRYNAIKSKELLTLQRSYFAQISHHKRITSDKVGEVRLSLKLILKFVTDYSLVFNKPDLKYNHKLNEYNIKKMLLLLKNLKGIHEDYQIEFVDDINTILDFFYNGIHAGLAKSLALPRYID